MDAKSKAIESNNGTVVVKSLWWPGSFTFFSKGKTLSIYLGDGLKNEEEGATYFPVSPPKMIDEREEKKPYDEPNPTDEWL